MHNQSCAECIRLWREYALATNADIKLNGQVKLAALRHDDRLSEQLAPASNAATHQRESLRQQIKEHEASHEDCNARASKETGVVNARNASA
jgi:hypothetical protein